ncbi:MAG: hypothetical protein ACC645_24690, partial [Pirellulales bacterium]
AGSARLVGAFPLPTAILVYGIATVPMIFIAVYILSLELCVVVSCAALVPAVAIGLNWKRATPAAANTSIAVSLVINFSLLFLQKQGIYLPYRMAPGAVALLVSLILFFGVSLLTRPGQIDADVEAIMEM